MKTIRTLTKVVLMLASLWLAAYSANLRAEDIDIYVDAAGTMGTPNVLFVIDNSSNLASTWSGGGCSAYNGTTEAPSLGTGTAGGVVQCALVDSINSLPSGALNIGIMVGNTGGFATDTRNATDRSYHETCMGDDGGCLLRKLTLMLDGTNASKQNLVNFIKSWSKNASTSTTFDFTINSAKSGQMMQEAWAYYNGRIGLSGKDYSPSLLQSCQKNFVIFIGNTDKTPNNEDVSGAGALASAGATTGQRIKITESVKFNPAICGNITSIAAGGSASDWSSNWADEWSRLMFSQDAGLSTQEGAQNIVTYTVGIINNGSNQCTADYPALLSKMAEKGGGKSFRVGNASEMTTALLAALNEVQAVNSVFSSASLPVSVNAEGSYLNQIFLGMFRPDSSGAPRWLGNLKQYQLIRNADGQLIMGDATKKAAISSGGTGFLAPDAVSFWTYRDDAALPDRPTTNTDGTISPGGFFRNDMKGTPLNGYDRADGEVVEKGGVAQQLRKQNLTANFIGPGGVVPDNPRRVYTYCPQGGTGCNPDLTDPSNDFSTANANISAAAFGSAITVPVTSIARTGSTGLVTTAGNHGFTTGSTVTIRNATQSAFNVTQAVTVNGPNTFTITGLPDWPTSPSEGTYTVSPPGATAPSGSFTMAGLTRTSSATTASSSETVTVVTTGTHTFVVNDLVKITGAGAYDRDGWRVTGATANSFTFSVPIYPSAPAAAATNWRVVHAPYTRTISTITRSGNGSNRKWTVETGAAHGFHVGQTVTISGVTGEPAYNANWVVQAVPTVTTFTIAPATNLSSAGTGNVVPSTTAIAATALTRTGTTANTTAVMSVAEANWFSNGDKVKISYSGASAGNDAAYQGTTTEVAISCSGSCTTFTYPIQTTPPLAATSLGTVTYSGGGAVVDPAKITRIGADLRTAQVTGIPPTQFTHGQVVEIAPTGTALNSEAAYVGSWTISCAVADCNTFTFGPVALFPDAAAAGNNIQAYSGTTSPNKDQLIKWLRGEDNAGDEKGPGNGVTVRGSIHGDVLHSRPLVVNYGDSRGIVVFYGSNDGAYRAVNGNTTGTVNGVAAGGELWSLILPEHYQLINRYRSNAPELKFPQSLLSSAQPKDYFVDGPTGVYQRLNADGSIAKAYLFLTMRRGGRLIYAIDVTQPASPRYLWSISQQTPGFEELGQTWSRPRLTLLQNLKAGSPAVPTPVLVFGAGYDSAQDTEPPGVDQQGRGIFVVNAETGALVWSASASCDAALYPCKQVAGMKYATPTDITFVDRDLDGFTDKFYWGDLGGNLWRADVADVATSDWKVTRVAQLGCDTGECASGTTPRKFFFPPAVLSVRAAGATDSYEALSIVSGDREHPLRTSATGSSYFVQDKFFMVKDTGTTVGAPTTAPSTSDVTASNTDLFDATSTLYDGSRKGFYINLLGNTATNDKGEKGVNAPVAVNGLIFFSTNRPTPRDVNTCAANLGEAKAYAVSPFSGKASTNVLAGGGLPPSAVSGLINITDTDANGNTTTTQEKFCIGCGLSGDDLGGNNTAPCTSALENCNIGVKIPKNLKRTYWYKK
jgi:type IV pilus assembly protein PilY1